MAGVSIENVEKTFGSLKVIRGVDIEARDGEFVALAGPVGMWNIGAVVDESRALKKSLAAA
jgi:ABC-type histidine transport system ATPase subunit